MTKKTFTLRLLKSVLGRSVSHYLTAQLKVETKATRNYQKRHMRFFDVFSKDSFSSDGFSSDEESLADNTSNIDQNLSSDNEIYWTIKHTGEKLVIDENTDTTKTNLISDTQNPENETIEKNKKKITSQDVIVVF